jgi:hypothetical protein
MHWLIIISGMPITTQPDEEAIESFKQSIKVDPETYRG